VVQRLKGVSARVPALCKPIVHVYCGNVHARKAGCTAPPHICTLSERLRAQGHSGNEVPDGAEAWMAAAAPLHKQYPLPPGLTQESRQDFGQPVPRQAICNFHRPLPLLGTGLVAAEDQLAKGRATPGLQGT